ncbi:MAG: PAS domain S-box protein [Deltaproteobacteria bacterium]|nr:PAS domain S-box protein [Deltaproteobacteria bacterium]
MIYIDLVLNLALLVALSIVSGFIEKRWSRHTQLRVLLQGILFGGTAVLGMLRPLNLGPGLIFDGRSVMVSLCALFFGPLAATVAVMMTVACRMVIGGAGTLTGSLVILSSAGIGLLAYFRFQPGAQSPSMLRLYLFGLAVHLVMLALMFTLPGSVGLTVVMRIGPPVLVFYPMATILVGKILSDQGEAMRLVEALQTIFRRFQIILSILYSGILVVSDDNRVDFVNQAFCDLFDLDDLPEDLLGLSAPNMIEKIKNVYAYPANEIVHIQEILAKNQPVKDEEITIRGKRAYLRDFIPIVIDGKQCGRLWHHHDITDLKRAEEALIESEQKFRSIFDNSFDAILLTQLDGHILAANQSACQLFGKSEEEICLVGSDGLVDPTDPNLAPTLDRRAKTVKVYAELTMLRQDGTKFTGEITSNVFRDRDGKDKTILIIRDITQRKMVQTALQESEEKFAKTFKYAPLLMTISNIQDGRYLDVNDKFSEVTGFSRDEVVGKTSLELGWMSREDLIELIEVLNKSGRIENMELSLTTKDKKSVVCLSAAEIISINGIKRLLSIAQDITQRKQIEAELLRAKEAAQYASRAKSEFLANMSHEIRTPMNSVMGFADLLIKSQLDTKQLEYASSIKQASGNLLFVLNDILDLSKIEAGKLELESITFNLGELCDQVIETFRVLSDKKGIKLSLEVSPDLHAKLHGDPNRLRQILNNLIGNAVKFTSRGSVELGVTQYGTNPCLGETNAVTLIFAVKDTGIGIPAGQRERIFDPFTQVDASTRRRYGGTGLGLNICKKLVELMGGEIWVKSTEGVGSTFCFSACFEKVHDSESLASEKGQTQPISLFPLKILLAEDDVLNQRFATEVLRTQGHSVEIATHGKEVIDKLIDKPFDLILMDISMPDMDGTEVTKVIRGSTLNLFDSKIPIIAQTAHALKGDREKFLESGMDGYIAKPIDVDELSAVIRQVMPHFIHADGAEQGKDKFVKPTDETIPIFDNRVLKNRFSGKQDLFNELFELFVQDLSNKISDLGASIDQGDFKALVRLAHAFKGSAATLAASALSRCAEDLEKFGHTEDLDAVKLHFHELKAEAVRLRTVSLGQLLVILNE